MSHKKQHTADDDRRTPRWKKLNQGWTIQSFEHCVPCTMHHVLNLFVIYIDYLILSLTGVNWFNMFVNVCGGCDEIGKTCCQYVEGNNTANDTCQCGHQRYIHMPTG